MRAAVGAIQLQQQQQSQVNPSETAAAGAVATISSEYQPGGSTLVIANYYALVMLLVIGWNADMSCKGI